MTTSHFPTTAPPDPDRRPTLHRISGLDGLRAVAVVAVVIFHLDSSLLPGGFLGVDVFFVISGFLITSLICTEIARTGRLQLGRFYLRRARRLLPTLLAVLLAVSIGSAAIWRDQLATLRGGVSSSLLYGTNWWLILDNQSYFVATGRPSMLQHLWSLAIEEQFYIVWSVLALVVAGVLRRRRPSDQREQLALIGRVAAVAAALAVASTIAMAFFAVRDNLPYGASTSRVYFGSDTHTMGLFLGSAAGAWLVSRKQSPVERGGRAPRPWSTDLVAVLGVAALVATFVRFDEYEPWLYRGGFLAIDALVLVVILCALRTGSLAGRLLDVRPLRWVGLRSYSIYLWHWPLLVVTRPDLDVHGPPLLVNSARLLLVLGVAALSYRLIETPLRRAGAVRWQLHRPGRRTSSSVAVAVLSSAVLVACAYPFASLGQAQLAQAEGPHHARHPHHDQGSSPSPTRPPAPLPTRPTQGPPTASPSQQPGSAPNPPVRDSRPSVSAFGDSVLLGAQAPLRAATAVLDLDAVEGNQAYTVLDDIAADAEAGRLQEQVLIHIGDNGVIDPGQLDDVLAELDDKRVVLVTLEVPRSWQEPNNQTLRSAADDHDNVVLVDWRSAAAAHPDWLYSDGIHLTPAGAVGYAALVGSALRG